MTVGDANATTCGLVCAHHHLYSTLARQVPGPERAPRDFLDILNSVWWRLDRGLDLEMIKWSAMLGAVEALCAGTTAIIDHHESPHAIEGSLDVIADRVGYGTAYAFSNAFTRHTGVRPGAYRRDA